MIPEMPAHAGALDTCRELRVGDDYLIDGRVSHGEVACGWNAAEVDVDVSLAAYNSNQKCVDVIWWDKKHSHYVACTHRNDDRHGISIKDTSVNEQISVRLILPPHFSILSLDQLWGDADLCADCFGGVDGLFETEIVKGRV